MKLKTLNRIESVRYALDTISLALEIADYVTRGGAVRALRNATRPKSFSQKRPADYTIKVRSSRE